jgi:TolA-binding protein
MTAGQVIDAVRAKNKQTKIIVLGASPERRIADQILDAGADAYIIRSGPSRHLNDAIRFVRDGGKYLAPELTQQAPVASGPATRAHQCEEFTSLRSAFEAQSRTVEKLESAMDRAQYAIGLLQQKVDQLAGNATQVSASPQAESNAASRTLSILKSNMGTVAAAVMVGFLGFMLAGILRPAPETPLAQISGAVALPALHLSRWETESVDKASTFLRSQKYADAEKVCRSLLKQNPANTLASRVLASALFHQNRVEESADVVRSMALPSPRVTSSSSHPLPFEN